MIGPPLTLHIPKPDLAERCVRHREAVALIRRARDPLARL
jgi:hypothetical protein